MKTTTYDSTDFKDKLIQVKEAVDPIYLLSDLGIEVHKNLVKSCGLAALYMVGIIGPRSDLTKEKKTWV